MIGGGEFWVIIDTILLKLADVHYLLGDLAAEKALRETFYGSLDPR